MFACPLVNINQYIVSCSHTNASEAHESDSTMPFHYDEHLCCSSIGLIKHQPKYRPCNFSLRGLPGYFLYSKFTFPFSNVHRIASIVGCSCVSKKRKHYEQTCVFKLSIIQQIADSPSQKNPGWFIVN